MDHLQNLAYNSHTVLPFKIALTSLAFIST